MKITIIFCCLISLVIGLPAWSQQEGENSDQQEVKERKFVTDKLRLSLYKQADAKSGTIKLLVSGDAVEILELAGPYSKVRTSAGDIGWVKNGFLVSKPTASFQLVEEQKKNEILSQQLEKYSDTKNLVADYENTISKMTEDFRAMEQDYNDNKEQLEKVIQQNQELNEQIEASQQGNLTLSDITFLLKTYWYAVVLITLFLLLVGFMVGRQMLESQVRRKFQGVKVW